MSDVDAVFQILERLNVAQVDYIVVEGMAAVLLGAPCERAVGSGGWCRTHSLPACGSSPSGEVAPRLTDLALTSVGGYNGLMTSKIVRVGLLLACFVSTSCDSSDSNPGFGSDAGTPRTSISATDYDRSCSVDTDCVAILVGNMCPCGSCTKGAINKGALTRAEADLKSINCEGDKPLCGACMEDLRLPYCNGGQCDMASPVDGGADANDAAGHG
jgi:hypothetical protein